MKTSAREKSRPSLGGAGAGAGAFAFVACLLSTGAGTTTATSDEGGCINDTTVIFDSETSIADPTAGGTRTYVLCPNTTYDVGYYNRDSKSYEDGMAAIELFNPNVHVLCGPDGRRENNCTLRYGWEHVFVASSFGSVKTEERPPLTNVLLSGLTFREAEDKVVSASAVTKEDGIVFKDCLFEDNYNVTGVVDAFSVDNDGVNPREMILVFDSCTFRNNDAAVRESLFGLVWNVDHIMKVHNCQFVNNRAISDPDVDTVSFILGNIKNNYRDGGLMEVTSTSFVNNTVSAALVYNELSETTATDQNNVALGNVFFATEATDEYCDGLAVFVDVAVGFEFDCEPFPSTFAPTLTPTESSAPTAGPTEAPADGADGDGDGVVEGAEEETKKPTVAPAAPSSAVRFAATAGQLAAIGASALLAISIGGWN